MKAKQTLKYTPRGMTQNWGSIQEQGGTKRNSKGGPFLSKSAQARKAHIDNNLVGYESKPEEKEVDTSTFTVKVNEAEEKVVTRVNGKFVKAQVYSPSLAAKLDL